MKHKTWAEMTDAEKGELLLAHHNGRTIEVLAEISGNWMEVTAPMWNASSIYRALPGPKREEVVATLKIHGGSWPQSVPVYVTVVDGEPDYRSVRRHTFPPTITP